MSNYTKRSLGYIVVFASLLLTLYGLGVISGGGLSQQRSEIIKGWVILGIGVAAGISAAILRIYWKEVGRSEAERDKIAVETLANLGKNEARHKHN